MRRHRDRRATAGDMHLQGAAIWIAADHDTIPKSIVTTDEPALLQRRRGLRQRAAGAGDYIRRTGAKRRIDHGCVPDRAAVHVVRVHQLVVRKSQVSHAVVDVA
jgi:hypothetical protein